MGGERQQVVPPFIRDRYRYDIEFRQRVDYACKHAIPYSRFLGGADEWLPDDRDIVAVWQEEQRGRCPECGTFAWEWEEHDEPWHPDHYTCYGCKSVALHRKTVEHTVTDGTKFALFRRARGD